MTAVPQHITDSSNSVATLLLSQLNKTPFTIPHNGCASVCLTVCVSAGILLLGAGCLIQLYVAGVNYARNAPEGYSPVADAKVR